MRWNKCRKAFESSCFWAESKAFFIEWDTLRKVVVKNGRYVLIKVSVALTGQNYTFETGIDRNRFRLILKDVNEETIISQRQLK